MTGESSDRSRYHIRAVERTCQLLDLLRRSSHPVSIAEAAEAIGIPKSSAFRYLTTLEDCRYALRDPVSGAYLAAYGSELHDLSTLRAAAGPSLVELRDALNETIVLAIFHADRPLYLETINTEAGVRVALPEEEREHSTGTALGRVLLAQLPDPVILLQLRANGLEPGEEETTILRSIEVARQRGWLFGRGDAGPETNAVAVPLPAGRPAAIAVVAPASRLPEGKAEAAARRLRRVALSLTAQLDRAARN